MNKFKKLAIVYPTVVMFAICLVITAALAGTNFITHEKIAVLQEQKELKTQKQLIKEADDFSEVKEIEYKDETYSYTVAKKSGAIKGYIFKIVEKGYGGKITVMVAVDTNGSVIAVKPVDVSTETPGLGQNTAKSGFTDQFAGKSGQLEAVKNGTASADTQIDAVASATISSKAVTEAVNKAIAMTDKIINDDTDDKPEEKSTDAVKNKQ